MDLVAQIVGILAVVTFLLSYQLKKRKNIIMMNATSSVLYVLQYILLGAFEGAALDIMSAFASVVAHNKDKKLIKKYFIAVVVIVNLMMVAVGLLLYKNIFSLFSIAGAIFQTGAFWLTDEKLIRRVSFFGAPFWLVYNLTSHAYGSAVGSVLCMISIGTAIFRYDIYPMMKNKQGESL